MDWEKCTIGLELGSTRIKAVLLDERYQPAASGSFEWENRLENGIWTYDLADARAGMTACYRALKQDVLDKTGEPLRRVGAIGVSGMMHGYLPFDGNWNQLAPFRTWRNTMTGAAAEALSRLFRFNIPQRWTIAHLYHSMQAREPHLSRLAHLTTLAGYMHFLLTGVNVLGVGEASGVFPVDSAAPDYDAAALDAFDALAAKDGYPWKLRDLLPRVLPAGTPAGSLTREGALLLDPDGDLQAGIPLCPPEGDAGTGMVATNAVRPGTGNVSAGTSGFAMLVVDRLPGMHPEIDMVTTPAGAPVAMAHCNNFTGDINAWVGLLSDAAALLGADCSRDEAFSRLFRASLEGPSDCGGLLSFNYISGEHVTGMTEGRPLFARLPDAPLSLPAFMRTQIYSALASLALGLRILTEEEKVPIRRLCGHGGFFRTPEVGQRALSAATGAPVTVMETAGEGGPYGMALLAAYLIRHEAGESLEDYLDRRVFSGVPSVTLSATPQEREGFLRFLETYKAALTVEREAVKAIR